MARGGKRKDAGRKSKYIGGTRWIHLAMPEVVALAIEAEGYELDLYILTLLAAARPDWHMKVEAAPADQPDKDEGDHP